jgi:hypothetical protein
MTGRGGGATPGERGLAVALLGAVLLNRPLLDVFDRGIGVGIAGWPLIYLYIFGGWGLVVLLLYLMTRRRD